MKPLVCELERKPIGAAPQGSKITISARADRALISRVEIIMRYDNDGCEAYVPMAWCDLHCGLDCYEVSIDTSDYRGLIWYYLRAHTYDGGTIIYGEHGTEEPRQITIYERKLETPNWYQNGVTYHVFVDRFYRASASPKLLDDPDFIVHHDMADKPNYLPDEHGEILNNDIYGGNLAGIIEKLPYLKTLGVTNIYLSPIFEAWSNHKYNTANYECVDSHFGSEEDLKKLTASARAQGMHVILDGVFNHTGADSLYFNRYGRYKDVGAYQSESSKFRNWYQFNSQGYNSWWGIVSLPETNEANIEYRNFIDEIAKKWLKCGISGWRLDVADELPDDFLQNFRNTVKTEKSDAVIIGEVWEDASNKIAYDVRRKYFTELELDGVMNYPLKDGILRFLKGEGSACDLRDVIMTLLEHYPEPVLHCLMNIIGTHDTPRVITTLARPDMLGSSRSDKANFELSDEERARGTALVRLAACLQFFFPGSPCIYYGDEAGVEGFEDPFNRTFYPWNREDTALREYYRKLGKLKRAHKAMQSGVLRVLFAEGDVIVLSRTHGEDEVIAAVNRGDSERTVFIRNLHNYVDIITNKSYKSRLGILLLRIPGRDNCVLTKMQ